MQASPLGASEPGRESWSRSFARDLRFGLRAFLRTPGLTAAVLVTLVLAIGANTAIFSVVYGVLLRPLPFPSPDRLVQIWELNRSEAYEPSTISPFNFLDWFEGSESFTGMAVYRYANLTLLGEDGPSRMSGVKVSGDFFPLLGVQPLLGRLPSAEDDVQGSRVVVLSHSAWQNRFGADAGWVGRDLILENEAHTVIGIMPPDFGFPSRFTEVWTLPAFSLEGLRRNQHFLYGIGRLEPEVTLAAAQTEMDAIAHDLGLRYPSSNDGSEILLVPLHEQMVGKLRANLLLLFGAVCLVLLIACGNVASLLLARAVSRQHEASVRLALGADRGRLIRQMLTESLLLALVGGGGGLLLAVLGTRLLAAQPGFGLLRSGQVQVDGWVLGFCAATSLLTGVVFGLLPAFQTSRARLYPLLMQNRWRAPRWSSKRRLLKLLVTLQVCLAIVLLVTAGLLLRSMSLLGQVETGFQPQGLVTMRLSLPSHLYPDPVERARLFEQVIARIGEVPGVERAAGVNDLPFSGSRSRVTFDVEGGLPSEASSEVRSADYRLVAGDYFSAMGIDLLQGEAFASELLPEGGSVAIVNEELVRRYFRDTGPIGRTLMFQGSAPRIIGVVRNLKHESLAAEDAPEIYVPAVQGQQPEWIFLAIRSEVDPKLLVPALRSASREVIPDHPVYDVQLMTKRLARSTRQQRVSGLILSIFAGIAFTLSLIGLYSTIAYAARERVQELAVRMALGARRSQVIRLVVLGGLVPVILGTVLGVAGAVAAGRMVRALLFGVGPADPGVIALVVGVVLLGALLAGFFPARRATAIDPAQVLRS